MSLKPPEALGRRGWIRVSLTPTLHFIDEEDEVGLVLTHTSQKSQAEFALSVLTLGTAHSSWTFMYSLKPCHCGKGIWGDLQEGTQKNQTVKCKQQKKTETKLDCKYVLFDG